MPSASSGEVSVDGEVSGRADVDGEAFLIAEGHAARPVRTGRAAVGALDVALRVHADGSVVVQVLQAVAVDVAARGAGGAGEAGRGGQRGGEAGRTLGAAILQRARLVWSIDADGVPPAPAL